MKRLALISTLFFIYQAALFANSPAPQPEAQSFTDARAKLVSSLKQRDIRDWNVLASMGKVQRHEFAPDKFKDRAYDDISIPLGSISTISQPYMVALMAEAIRPKPAYKVLEIGTASGYNAAVLAEMVSEVYTIEIMPELANKAGETLKRLGYTNIHVKAGDGFFGWPEEAPFDAIILTCAADKVPPKLAEQLKEGGRLVMPLGDTYSTQSLSVITKVNGQLVSRPLVGVRFVPMVGEIKK